MLHDVAVLRISCKLVGFQNLVSIQIPFPPLLHGSSHLFQCASFRFQRHRVEPPALGFRSQPMPEIPHAAGLLPAALAVITACGMIYRGIVHAAKIAADNIVQEYAPTQTAGGIGGSNWMNSWWWLSFMVTM